MHETDGRRLGQKDQEGDRIRAGRLLLAGKSADQVAEIFGRSRARACNVRKAVLAGGIQALAAKPRPEGAKALDGAQRQELFRIIRDHIPQDFGFESALWNRGIVADLIYERFGVEVSLPTVGSMLRDLGLSPQRPIRRAVEQDPEAVRRWRDEEFPQIRAQAIREGADLYFGDEAGVRSDYHSGTTWAPVGQTPVVHSTGDRKSVSMLSAITMQGRIDFDVCTGMVNSAVFIEFCKKVLANADGGKVYMIIDRASYHTSKITSEFVKSTEGQLKLFFLPSYAPELNPDELVWKNVKHDQIGKSSVRNADDLKSKATRALQRLRECPDLIRGFFRHPGLAFIHV